MKSHLARLISFSGIGLINTFVDFSVYAVCVLLLSVPVIPANLIAFLTAVLGSYILNSLYTFRGLGPAGQHGRKLSRFIAVNGIGFVISTILVAVLSPHIGPIAAKLPAIGAVLIWGYFGSYFLVFRDSGSPKPD